MHSLTFCRLQSKDIVMHKMPSTIHVVLLLVIILFECMLKGNFIIIRIITVTICRVCSCS